MSRFYIDRTTKRVDMFDAIDKTDIRETKEFAALCKTVKELIARQPGITINSIKHDLEYRLTMAIDTLMASGAIESEGVTVTRYRIK